MNVICLCNCSAGSRAKNGIQIKSSNSRHALPDGTADEKHLLLIDCMTLCALGPENHGRRDGGAVFSRAN